METKKVQKQTTNIRLSPHAKMLLRALATKAAVSMSAWLETVIRAEAKRERLP